MPAETGRSEALLDRILAAIDRGAGVPIPAQLHGLLEFGISSGNIRMGEQLPSVRKLAGCLGLSPVTVSQVYAQLGRAGLISGRVGAGTYVSGLPDDFMPVSRTGDDFQLRVRNLISFGLAMGKSPDQIVAEVAEAAGEVTSTAVMRKVRILVLGRFQPATDGYAEDVRQLCGPNEIVTAATLDSLPLTSEAPPDVIMAPLNMRTEAREAFPSCLVLGMTMIPNEATRISLARVPPGARVVAASFFPEFLPTLREGIGRHAPHLGQLVPLGLDDARLADEIRLADAVVFSTGAEAVREHLRPGQDAFEFRHSPDLKRVQPALAEAVAEVRGTYKITTGGTDEDQRQQLV